MSARSARDTRETARSVWGTLDRDMKEKVLSHVVHPVSQWSRAYRNLLGTSRFLKGYVNLRGKSLRELLFEYRKVHCPSVDRYDHVKALVPALRADLLLLFDHGKQSLCTMLVAYVDGRWQCREQLAACTFVTSKTSVSSQCVITPDASVGVHMCKWKYLTKLTVFSPLDGRVLGEPFSIPNVSMSFPRLSPSGKYAVSEVLIHSRPPKVEIHVYDMVARKQLHTISPGEYPGDTWNRATEFRTIHWLDDDTVRWLAWELKGSDPPHICTGIVRLYSLSVTTKDLSFVQTRVSDAEFILPHLRSKNVHVANVGLNGWCASLIHKLDNDTKCFSMLRLDPEFEKVDEVVEGDCASLWNLPIAYVDDFHDLHGSPTCFEGPYAAHFDDPAIDYQILDIHQLHPRFLGMAQVRA